MAVFCIHRWKDPRAIRAEQLDGFFAGFALFQKVDQEVAQWQVEFLSLSDRKPHYSIFEINLIPSHCRGFARAAAGGRQPDIEIPPNRTLYPLHALPSRSERG